MQRARATRPPVLDGTPFGLCTSVEGVEFWSTLDDGYRIRSVITRAALHAEYGAVEDQPVSWLKTFVQCRQRIAARVEAAVGDQQGVDLVVLDHAAAVRRIHLRSRSTHRARECSG